MATRKRSSAFLDAEKFSQSLRTLVDALPSDADRQEAILRLDNLITFLGDLRMRIERLPSRQDAAGIRTAIDGLTAMFTQAKANPVLSLALGLKPTAPRARLSQTTVEEIERARSVLARFESLPIDDIRTSLDAMTPKDLQAVARAIGLRTSQRTAREALIHQIATKITNTRGYRTLRDGTTPSS